MSSLTSSLSSFRKQTMGSSDWLEDQRPSDRPTLSIGQYHSMKVRGSGTTPHMRNLPIPWDMRNPSIGGGGGHRAASRSGRQPVAWKPRLEEGGGKQMVGRALRTCALEPDDVIAEQRDSYWLSQAGLHCDVTMRK